MEHNWDTEMKGVGRKIEEWGEIMKKKIEIEKWGDEEVSQRDIFCCVSTCSETCGSSGVTSMGGTKRMCHRTVVVQKQGGEMM